MFLEILAVFFEIMEHAGGKIRYDRFEKPAKNLFLKFYDKKYIDDYKGIKYTPYSSYYDDENCDDYEKETKIDEIDKVEDLFKINVHIYIRKMIKNMLKLIEEITENIIKIFIYYVIIIIFAS